MLKIAVLIKVPIILTAVCWINYMFRERDQALWDMMFTAKK